MPLMLTAHDVERMLQAATSELDDAVKSTNDELLFVKGMVVALSIHTNTLLAMLCHATGRHPELITMVRNVNRTVAAALPEKVAPGAYRDGMEKLMEMTDEELAVAEKS